MSRRLNREDAPAKPGAFWNTNYVFSMTPPSMLDLRRCLVNDLSGHTDCCGSECKLFHLGSLLPNSLCRVLVDCLYVPV